MEIVAGLSYDKSVDKELGTLIETCYKDQDALEERERANLNLARRNYQRLIKTPRSLATKIAELESRGYEVWAEAREKNNWAQFAPIVQEWIDLRKEQARLIEPEMDVYGGHLRRDMLSFV
jgi:carboxypeptidase Taq